VIDPFTIQGAEELIAAIHKDWGEAQGNYDEFRFFTGLRPSEQIALLVSDCDIAQGKISVTKARVMTRDKDRTKTSEDRIIELCPRALEVLKRHLALPGATKARRRDQARRALLQGERRADTQSPVPVRVLASHAHDHSQRAVSRAV
jgi:integrase